MKRALTLLNLLLPVVLATSCGVRTEPVPYISLPREKAPEVKASAPASPTNPAKTKESRP